MMTVSIDLIQDIELISLRRLFAACGWDWLEPDLRMREALEASTRLFTARENGELVGFARVLGDEKIYGFVVDLMVAPKFRRKGVGKDLLTKIEEQARADGLKLLQLLSSAEGKSLYLKSGFKECPAQAPGMTKLLEAIDRR